MDRRRRRRRRGGGHHQREEDRQEEEEGGGVRSGHDCENYPRCFKCVLRTGVGQYYYDGSTVGTYDICTVT